MAQADDLPDAADNTPRVLGAKYQVFEAIGSGGMGTVYRGKHRELNVPIAIKCLRPDYVTDGSARARVLREARAAASMQGEHSTRILDVGTDAEGAPFIVMEYLEGETLDARLRRDGPLRVEDAATVALQLLDVLAEAHARGLVHRDIKPANLFLVHKPGEPLWIKVLDFGISKSHRADAESVAESTLTEPRTLLGSPHYMSPEQLRDSSSVDHRCDIWSAGVLLFELLSGQHPFEGPTLADLCAQIVSRAPRSLASVGVRNVPAPIERLIQRCLEKDPEHRPSSVLDLARVLAPYARPAARPLAGRIAAQLGAAESPLSSPKPTRTWGIVLVVAAACVAFVLASLRAVPPRGVATASSAPVVRDLAPVEPAPPQRVEVGVIDAGSPSTADAAAPSATQGNRKPPAARRTRDLDSIELIP